MQRRVWLKSGSYRVIDETEALTVIDVNTGKYIGEDNLQDTITKTNVEAAEEIARQLRLRDIGGIIAVSYTHLFINDMGLTTEGSRPLRSRGRLFCALCRHILPGEGIAMKGGEGDYGGTKQD